MVVENEANFLPKPKPITDLKKDFKLLGRLCIHLKWSLFEPKNLCCALATIEALNIWIFKHITLVASCLKSHGQIFGYVCPLIYHHTDWAVADFLQSTSLR